MQKRKSIGFLLSTLGGLLGALLIGLAVTNTVTEWRSFRSTGAAAEVNAAADAILVAIERMTLERGLTNTALNGETPAAAAPTGAIKARRAEMRKAMAAGWPAMAQLSYLVEEGTIRKAEAAVAAIDALRERADQAIQRPRAERDASVQQQWYATLTQGIEAITDVWQGVTQRLSGLDPQIAALNDVKFLAALMREYAGRERALLGAGKPIETEKRLDVADWRARVGLTWEQITSIFPKATAPAAINGAIAAANERFFAQYVPVRDKAYQNLIAARPLGMSGKEWSDASNPGLDAIVGIRDAAIASGAAHLQESHAAALRSLIVNCALVLIALGLTVMVYVLSRSRVSTPLRQIAAALQQLNDGRLDVAFAKTRRNDEIGAINDALTLFRDQSLRMREIEQQRAETERKTAEERRAAMHQLADAFQGAVGGIVNTVSTAAGQLATAAGTLTKTAETTQQLSGMVTSASEEASANVQSVASATEELTSSVHEIARQVHESSRIAGDAVKQAEKTDARIAALSKAAGRIGDVVKLITAVAEQTNLLALNATIEAARAGEAGRGFAVVASEVKQLASQTAKATEEIDRQVTAIREASIQMVKAVHDITQTIGNITGITTSIAGAIEQQNAATAQISENLERASSGTEQVTQSVSEMPKAAAETGDVAERLDALAHDLAADAGSLQRSVDSLLTKLAA